MGACAKQGERGRMSAGSGGDGLGKLMVHKERIRYRESLVLSKPQEAVQIGA